MPTICEYCGKSIEFPAAEQVFCCPACRSRAMLSAQRKARAQLRADAPKSHAPRRTEKTCADCGVSFLGYPRSYRCPACQTEAQRASDRASKARAARAQTATIDRRVCPVCGKLFAPTTAHPRTCSDACARIALSYHRRAYVDRKRAQAQGTGVPDAIRAARSALGLSRQQLAEALGYKNSVTVQQWEQGMCLPPREKIGALADVLHIPIETLLPSSSDDK